MEYKISKIENNLKVLTTIHKYRNQRAMIRENKILIDNKSIEIYGVFYNEKLIGCIHIKYKSKDERFVKEKTKAYIFGFRVLKEYQNKGIGKYLLSYMLDKLKEDGFKQVTVGVEKDNHIAKTIYQKFGFNEKVATIVESYQGDEYEYELFLKNL